MYGKCLLIGGLVIAATGGLVYLWYNKYHSPSLDDWLNEYIDEVEQKLKKNRDKPPSAEVVAYVINLFEEIEDYLYVKGTETQERERLQIRKVDTKKYEKLILDAITVHERYLEYAAEILKNRLGVEIDEYRNLMRKFEHTEMKNALLKCRKPYKSLPSATKETIRNAYLDYVETRLFYNKIALMFFNAAMQSPENDTYAKESYIFNKHLIRDHVFAEYQIREKYLDQLLTLHNLNEDTEIIQAKDGLSTVMTS